VLTKSPNFAPLDFEKVGLLSLVIFGFIAPNVGIFKIPLVFALVFAINWPHFLRTEFFWFIVLLLQVVGLGLTWHSSDGFFLLPVYWSFSLFLLHKFDLASTQNSARLILGVHFLLAGISKATAVDYLTGDFWYWLLAMEPRLSGVAQALGGITPDQIHQNLHSLRNWGSSEFVFQPLTNTLLPQLLTWSTLGLEFAVAIAFLLNLRYRDWLLIGFIVVVQSSMMVIGFAAMHCLLGYIQAQSASSRLAYQVAFALLLIIFLIRGL
jgi:hypothetical protein